MKKMVKACVFALLLMGFLMPSTLFAQYRVSVKAATDAYFHVPDVLLKAGVKQAKCLYRDSHGFLWVGTANGLYRFDGSHVIYLRHILNDSTTIPDNTINNIVEDASGRIWVGTHGGVSCINAYNLSCKVYSPLNRRLNDIFDSRVVGDVHGGIWCGNVGGVYKFEPSKETFVKVWGNNQQAWPAASHVVCVSDYGQDSLVVSTYTSLVFLDKHHFGARIVRFRDIAGTPTFFITRLLIDGANNLWISTWNDGLFRYERSTCRFIPYQISVNGATPIIFSMACGTEKALHHLWLGLPGGVFKLTLDQQWQLVQNQSVLYKGRNSNALLESRNALDLLPDPAGNIWVADLAVQYFNSTSGAFKEVFGMDGNLSDLQEVTVGSKRFYLLSVWYRKKGLYIFDESFRFVRSISLPLLHQEHNNVSGVAQDKFGRIWVSSMSGVYLLGKNFGLVGSLPYKGKDALSTPETNAIAIIHDTVWVACYQTGIDLFDLQMHRLGHYTKNDGSGISEDLFNRFFADSNGRTWICGDNCLYLFDRNRNSFNRFLLTGEARGCGPREIAERPDHTFLIASEHGLIHFNPVTGKYNYLTTPLLFNEEGVYSLCLGRGADPWYLTNEHLVNYSFLDNQFHVYGKEDGLNVNRDFFVIRQFAGKPMFIAQQGQVVLADTSQLHQNVERPGIFITDIRINDSIYNFASPVKKLKLSYAQNKLYFGFTGINFQKAYQNNYAYILDGVDKTWTYTNQNSASYASLSPGNYRFLAKVKNYAGLWSPTYVIAVQIDPPFWKEWWFIFLALAFMFSLIYLIYRYQLRQALKIEQLRNKISSDLHDDIGSTLSSISILTDIAIKEESREQSRQMISEVKATSISLMEKMDDIVWSINPENDHLEDIFLRIRRFASKVLEAKGISFEISMNQEMKQATIPMEYRQHIYMILKEGINNCVKYAACSHVKLDLKYHEPFLEILLCDNGAGFDMDHVQLGNGLMNMRQRAALMKSKIKIESAPGAGTMIRLQVKIL